MPTHLDLPDSDGMPVENALQQPQTALLNDAMRPWLEAHVHPDRQYFIGTDVGIYWQWTKDNPLRGCKSPDWYYVPGVPALRDGRPRLSYVLWQEQVAPLILIEYVSGDGADEHDTTPGTGKFWVYEQRIQAEYYIIFDEHRDEKIHAFRRIGGRYQPMKPNDRGHYPIPPMLAELGLWQATFQTYPATWLRWFDLQGNMLPTGDERAEQEKQRADKEKQRAEQLAARLRELGIDPDAPPLQP
jgi:Uma2 family endonuclease